MESASVARELSAHHRRLADGRFAGTVRCRTFRSGPRGFGADQGPTERVRRQCAHADTQAGAVRRYATLAQSYRAQVRKGYSDPAKMRAALDQAQKPLADMKAHTDGCMNMMSMMQKMQQK